MLAVAPAPLSAAPGSAPAVAYRVSSIEKYGAPSIVVGDPAEKVQGYLGRPDEKLGPRIWVYRDFIPSHPQAKTDACGTVVITFSEGRIVEIHGVNAAALKILAAQQTAAVNATLLAAVK